MHTLARHCPMGRVPTSTPDLPEDVLALLDHHLLDRGGTYGNPNWATPIQYDELRIEHDQGEVEIVVYNRAVLLFHDRQRRGEADSSGVLPVR